MPIDEDKKREIRQIFQRFLQRRAGVIHRLKIDDLHVNPFLIRIMAKEMGWNDARSIVRWLVGQRLERGTVTSFGLTLQEAAQVFSEGTGVEGADILKTKAGVRYYIQVKSGPNTIPKDLGVRIAQLLRSAQRRNRGSTPLFGMCYGSKEQVSSIVRQYVQNEGGVDWITGREFWEFISDEPDCIEEVYAIAAEVGGTFRNEQGHSLSEILEAKIDELTIEFERLYGPPGEDMWKNLLDRNS